MTSPQAELHYRLSDALGAHDVDFDTRTTIQQAYIEAGLDDATWGDLPDDIQSLIMQIETLPRTSWADPADAPDDLDDEEEDATDEPGVARADTTPGHDQLHHWWTAGPGLAEWIESPHQFETLRDHLLRYPFFQEDPERANKAAAEWIHEVTGNWPGSDAHRVAEGGKPRGDRIGPG